MRNINDAFEILHRLGGVKFMNAFGARCYSDSGGPTLMISIDREKIGGLWVYIDLSEDEQFYTLRIVKPLKNYRTKTLINGELVRPNKLRATVLKVLNETAPSSGLTNKKQ